MADELDLSNRGAEPPPQKEDDPVGTGVLLGCATNLALLIVPPFVAYMAFGFTSRVVSLANVLVAVLIANGIVIFSAYRRGRRGIVIGFAIAGSVALLLGTMCWSPRSFF